MAGTGRVFEEVGSGPSPGPAPEVDRDRGARRLMSAWLLFLAFAVALLIVVGGLTRLTDSGLSITEWRPVTGILPPLSADDWLREFERYKAVPEYRLQNSTMNLAGFKVIYWWEWGHRLLGRVVGLVWAAGFAWLLVRGKLSRFWVTRLAVLGALGALQGLVGWWMVSSGLTGQVVDVASYRLAIHAGLAFAILGLLVWSFWQARRTDLELYRARKRRDVHLSRRAALVLALAFVQIVLGALTAGLDAGRGYTDWPLMNGEFLPSESFGYTPLWINFVENPALVQFNHRIAAYALLVATAFVWFASRSAPQASLRRWFAWMPVVVLCQSVLGVVTLMHGAAWHAALTHQVGAMVVLIVIVRARFVADYPPDTRIGGRP